jgi:hypothetical protein
VYPGVAVGVVEWLKDVYIYWRIAIASMLAVKAMSTYCIAQKTVYCQLHCAIAFS